MNDEQITFAQKINHINNLKPNSSL